MYRILVIFSLLLVTGARVTAQAQIQPQNDSVCAKLLQLYNALDSKDKNERNKYKILPAVVKEGTLGKVSVFKSAIGIPGFGEGEFHEGGGDGRMFTTYKEFSTYEAAVKYWEEFNTKMHACFIGNWTFTNNNDPRELYRTAKLVRDDSLLAPAILYRVERANEKFRLMLQIVY